jgi:hypothetical protein
VVVAVAAAAAAVAEAHASGQRHIRVGAVLLRQLQRQRQHPELMPGGGSWQLPFPPAYLALVPQVETYRCSIQL